VQCFQRSIGLLSIIVVPFCTVRYTPGMTIFWIFFTDPVDIWTSRRWWWAYDGCCISPSTCLYSNGRKCRIDCNCCFFI
jgi:hypothetical protein